MKKFELTVWLGRNNAIQKIDQMLLPYQNWDIEEVTFTGVGVTAASVLVAVVKNMALLNGNEY